PIAIRLKSVLIACCVSMFATGGFSAAVWQNVNIEGLPGDAQLGSVWARSPTEAYVWANLYSTWQSFLYRWNGASWQQVLALTNHQGGRIFGTGPSDVFVSAAYDPTSTGNSSYGKIFRSADNGTNWTDQILP